MPTGLFNSEKDMAQPDLRQKLLRALLDSVLEKNSTQAHVQPEQLARRELPPGNWAGLYMLYIASCRHTHEEAASQSTFYAVAARWKCCLRFRKKSTHTSCRVRELLRSKMRHAKNFWQHAAAADECLGHLTTTWSCREAYWAARAESRHKQNLLTLIVDGFDRSKSLLPRWPRGRAPKQTIFERVVRPNVNVSAVYAHGWCFNLFLSDEHMSVGSNYSWETLLITINEVWKLAREEGKELPPSCLAVLVWFMFWSLGLGRLGIRA